MSIKDYESVIGLEVHIELKTEHKLFCECATTFGAPPNTQVCPVCLAMPGALPAFNQQVAEFAILAGLATHCSIEPWSRFDRKNYFYPDLPKAYQVTQNDFPLCRQGYLDITTSEGVKRIRIARIHIEEDAGKLIHLEDEGTLVDCNRCGVPLIEIVSEPDMRNGEEAVAYLRKLRAMARYTGISDGKMNEGSLRCDVNLSVRKKGQEAMGTRVELKNLNSFNFIARAIDSEFKRQVALIEEGGTVVQETRRFDEKTGQTLAMRKKEEAADYRYFPDPDLVPLEVMGEEVERIRAGIPRLADERKAQYIHDYDLTDYEAERLTDDKELSDFFERAVVASTNPKTLVNMILADVAPLYTEDTVEDLLNPVSLGRLSDLMAEGLINSNTGRKVLKALMEEDFDPDLYIEEHDLAQINDREKLMASVERSIQANDRAVKDFLKGKESAMRSLIGGVMRETGGRANPILAEAMIREAIEAPEQP
ncbi:MAG: Asp-tRNA(Asn)/Glu-tRNA(Gln) amidotransferase subunit GatB [Clostridiaceae bacterium]|jgi:aspartyl-tRNA(Asn)/glutamyl-tRNA(Gln) amidotransferase subunit B|nr:Asp-tRNA(Asn)/Glu-tRNA(Gln) amidotransferase subunit GatB [Clostridiaceae bacterium]